MNDLRWPAGHTGRRAMLARLAAAAPALAQNRSASSLSAGAPPASSPQASA